WFDGEINKTYSEPALSKIVMLSDDFKTYSSWNGKGNLTEENKITLDSIVSKVHQLKKKIRFWDAPDFINAWYQFMNLQVDYINTDHIKELSSFLLELPATSYTSDKPYTVYEPTYKSDGVKKPVKNVILLIGDGTALPQLYAGYTANHGALNIFKMKSIGISKTSSYDNYITDSAPGSTSIASGVKTKNHYVGVDHTGAPLKLLPVYLQKRKIKTGLVTCGDITDATPADFYAHQKDRGNSKAIIRDLKGAPVNLLMGSGNESLENVALFNDVNRKPFNDTIIKELEPEYTVVNAVDSVPSTTNKKWIVVEKKGGLSMLNGRGDWLMKAFSKTLDVLSKNKEGFFIMTEGAQIDYGGHDNNISYVATEVADFDKVLGKALAFADSNGETLVIVTADHETGGLTLLEGDYTKGHVGGRFSTSDHTALPVMVFAYGPNSEQFRGVYENTELFKKILNSFGISGK
ncbi:MAG: alkaline phosphatase, partial [Bacteroidota bacterium]